MDKTVKALTQAINHAGSRAALARLIKSKPSTIQYWLAGKNRVPAEFCLPIETATDGAITREHLRPDIFQ